MSSSRFIWSVRCIIGKTKCTEHEKRNVQFRFSYQLFGTPSGPWMMRSGAHTAPATDGAASARSWPPTTPPPMSPRTSSRRPTPDLTTTPPMTVNSSATPTPTSRTPAPPARSIRDTATQGHRQTRPTENAAHAVRLQVSLVDKRSAICGSTSRGPSVVHFVFMPVDVNEFYTDVKNLYRHIP